MKQKKLGKLFVLSGPSGSGKTTLIKKLQKEFSEKKITQAITYTTRSMREGEVDGNDYHFVTKKEFKRKIDNHDFLEYVNIFGCFYGTDRKEILDEQAQGKDIFLVIDTQGALKLKKQKISSLVTIFLFPPSKKALYERLEKRKEASIATRIAYAEREIKKAPYFDYHILNKDLDVAYDVLRSIVISEEHRSLYKAKECNTWFKK